MKSGEPVQISTKSACLNCGKVCDGATAVGIEGAVQPSSDDVTICIYCGHLMAFDANLHFRELTGEEMLEVAADERILAVSRARSKL